MREETKLRGVLLYEGRIGLNITISKEEMAEVCKQMVGLPLTYEGKRVGCVKKTVIKGEEIIGEFELE